MLAAQMPTVKASANPVSDTVRQMVARDGGYLVKSAAEMPAGKYGYHPTPEQMTFGHLVLHVATSNGSLCSAIGGMTKPDFSKLKDTDPKDALVQAITKSVDFCASALAKVTDAQLGDEVPGFRGKTSRAAVMLTLATDLADHYSQAAGYLRLNGLLPPSAQPRGSGRGRR